MFLIGNPGIGNFVLTADGINDDEVLLEVMNSLGQVVYRYELEPVDNRLKHTVHLKQVTTGLNFLKLTYNNTIHYVKFTIAR